jgi:hypothetical protein
MHLLGHGRLQTQLPKSATTSKNKCALSWEPGILAHKRIRAGIGASVFLSQPDHDCGHSGSVDCFKIEQVNLLGPCRKVQLSATGSSVLPDKMREDRAQFFRRPKNSSLHLQDCSPLRGVAAGAIHLLDKLTYGIVRSAHGSAYERLHYLL